MHNKLRRNIFDIYNITLVIVVAILQNTKLYYKNRLKLRDILRFSIFNLFHFINSILNSKLCNADKKGGL